jgi:hypothetical protein
VIQLRHQQPSLWEGLFAEEVAALWEPWMRVVELLEDDELLEAVYQAQGKRHRRSRTRGRRQTPAEVALRMLILGSARLSSVGSMWRAGAHSQSKGIEIHDSSLPRWGTSRKDNSSNGLPWAGDELGKWWGLRASIPSAGIHRFAQRHCAANTTGKT